MTPARSHSCDHERGAALVLAVLFTLALSAVGASMVVLARTETMASANYRLMSQARYGAESGVHKAINYLLNTYTLPGTGSDPLSNYDMTVSPVRYLGQPVVLSTKSGTATNYPDAAIRTAFAAAGRGTLTAGSTTVTYTAAATLLSMRTTMAYGTGATTVVQTWRIDAAGTLAGVQGAAVEVSALLEQQIVAAHTYAAFATNSGCGALTFSGGVVTDSYDSNSITMVSGHPVTTLNSGHVGTNGNLTEGGGSVVNGSLSTPRSGVGNCRAGAITALTANGNAQVTGGIITLPQAVTYAPPAIPNPAPPTTGVTINPSATCASMGMVAPKCTGAGGNFTWAAGATALSLGNVQMTGGSTLHLAAGTYNLNSLTLAGNSNLVIDSGPVIMNIVGTSQATPLDLTGGTTSNLTFDPSIFQVLYAGTGTVKLAGGTSSAAMVYAPRAGVSLSGGANFYGSILGASVSITGGTALHYDRNLSNTFYTVGNHMLSSFSWKKF